MFLEKSVCSLSGFETCVSESNYQEVGCKKTVKFSWRNVSIKPNKFINILSIMEEIVMRKFSQQTMNDH